jgi:hypothetical protein
VTDSRQAVHTTTLVDISEGGAWVRCAPQINVGESGVLRIKGFAPMLAFTVRTHDGQAAHVAFTLAAGEKAELAGWVARNFGEAAAA